MELDFITDNAIIYVLVAWVAIFVTAKTLKLERYGFTIKPYSLTYKNYNVQTALTRLLGRTRRGIRVFADVSVVAGFLMMGFAFWFLFSNITNFFVQPSEFAELTVLIPGVTLTSASAIMYFLLSIPIVLVVHEGAHGIVATLEKIKIKTGGFAIFIAMFAGFVEPDEEEFDNAKKISRLRVIGAGATSNVIFAFGLGVILLTNPMFAMILPEPFLGWFYESPEGVLVLSIIEGGGAEKAGIKENDIITNIGDVRIISPMDFQKVDLKPGQTVDVTILRDGQQIIFPVSIMASPDDPERGLVGIMRDNNLSFKPIYNYIEWNNPQFSMFLLWLWMISFFIGIINMLPLPILDGGKFIQTIIDKKFSEKTVNGTMMAIYAFTFIIFGLNIGLSYMKSGWFTI
uniref:Peptidase M50 n=1 Tax=uncultured marine thaumarchaeote KM3_88_E12 TaxID=1456336 RepID=A0A075HX51_9ARCH|nr:peptidase M50 [uncultured marine thaumarchaeote KM3_88_E12]